MRPGDLRQACSVAVDEEHRGHETRSLIDDAA
jgi:hypothetical protein